MKFKDLNIIEPILRALNEANYEVATPIQEKSIPALLEGKDMLGCAQTGTGKTAAFALPIVQNVFNSKKQIKGPKPIQALILAPTRELAIQIQENISVYSKYVGVKNTVVFGGVSKFPQIKALKYGVDILIATPGRLIDLVNQKYIKLNNIKYLVLDEADRMLDMGMIEDVKRIISMLPKERQNLLFSATMPKEVEKLVDNILNDPVKVEVTPVSSTVDIINQGLYFVDKKHKRTMLIRLLEDNNIKSALVFTRTKRAADIVTKDLTKANISAKAIHGDKSQNARQRALNKFKDGSIKVLVATDIAARGIDITELSHVVNFDMPEEPETYVHRIGRTGRAGHEGTAISLCDEESRHHLMRIEKLINKRIPVIADYSTEEVVEVNAMKKKPRNYGKRNYTNKRYTPNTKQNSQTPNTKLNSQAPNTKQNSSKHNKKSKSSKKSNKKR